MANPPAGSTPTYHLRWPGGSDPAEGPTGFQNLANDTETALEATRNLPTYPWVTLAHIPGTVGAGATVRAAWTLSGQSADNIHSLGTGGTSLVTTRPGAYLLMFKFRTVNTGTIVNGVYLQAFWGQSVGGQLDFLVPIYGSSNIDLFGQGVVRILAPVSGVGFTCDIFNQSSQGQTFGNTSYAHFYRVGD
jgi:hypothetical protein